MRPQINRLLLVIITAGLMPSISGAVDSTYFADCVLKHVKAGMDDKAVSLIRTACATKATPKECRQVPAHPRSPHGDPVVNSQEACLDRCKEAGVFSKKFGACSLG
jgi:hypothetical protein